MKRRGFLLGAGGLLMAPALVRASSLMPVSAVPHYFNAGEWTIGDEYSGNITITLRNGLWRVTMPEADFA